MKYINIILFVLSCIIYFILIMILPYGDAKKEIDFIFVLAVPCIMIFLKSLKDKNRKKYLWFYLIAYILALLGFVFSENRINTATINRVVTYEVNLVPFKSIYDMLTSWAGIKFGLYNIIGNFLMLTPLAILLPKLWNSFRKWYVFFITILSLSLVIELVQYNFNIGAFDIDDIILNFLGGFICFLILKINFFSKLIDNIFINYHVSNKIIDIGYYVLLIISCLICLFMTLNIIDGIKGRIINLNYLKCQSDEETFVGNIGNYHYYSKCNYGKKDDIYIGNIGYTLLDFLNEDRYEKYKDDLGLTREKIFTKVKVYPSKNNKPRAIYESERDGLNNVSKYYYLGIDRIIVTHDNNEEEYFDVLKSFEQNNLTPYDRDYLNIDAALLKPKKVVRNFKKEYLMSIWENKSFKAITCYYNFIENHNAYIFFALNDYEVKDSFCLNVEKFINNP